MTVPRAPIAPPEAVRRIAGDRPVSAVWVNQLGGVTFAITGPAGAGAGPMSFVKVLPLEHAGLLTAEAQRLWWAGGYLAVPRVLDTGFDPQAGIGWLHTRAVPGRSAVDPHWTARPEIAVRAIATGLRRLHDTLPVDDCPFGPPAWLIGAPCTDPVVCHGDACAPNTLIADDGTCTGHVDLGALGVGDRWADLAAATLSLSWNYPGEHESEFFGAYGIAPDAERLAVFRRLWEADGAG